MLEKERAGEMITQAGMRDRSGATTAVLEAVAQAVGARRAFLLPAGAPLPSPRRVGWLRREPTHLLPVEVPGEDPPRRLVLEFDREPALEDGLVAKALARAFEPSAPGAPARRRLLTPPPAALLEALVAPDVERPQRLLEAVLGALGAQAGGLSRSGVEPRAWTHGAGRPVLQNAALEALSGPDGRIEVLGRVFLIRQLVFDGTVVGGLAVEGGVDSAALRGCLALLAEALRPRIAVRAEEPVVADTGDLRPVLSSMPVPALAVDASGVLVAASPEAERIFQLTEFDFGVRVGARLGALRVDDVLAGGDPPDEVSAADGWYECSAVALPSGGRLFVLARRGAQEDLLRSQDALVAAMAHELRTPAAGVKALLEVLKMTGTRMDPGKFDGLLAEGIREVFRLERLVEDLLLTSRVATGGIHARPDTIELRPVVEEVLRHLQPRHTDHRFDVRGEARAKADPSLIRHAVWHLLDNAAKFSEPGARVLVEIEDTRKGPEIRVTDEGPGIFSGDLPDLFRPFQRLERNSVSAHGGAGIGLYLVKAVTEANGGEVWVRSRLGKGSTFGVRLSRG